MYFSFFVFVCLCAAVYGVIKNNNNNRNASAYEESLLGACCVGCDALLPAILLSSVPREQITRCHYNISGKLTTGS